MLICLFSSFEMSTCFNSSDKFSKDFNNIVCIVITFHKRVIIFCFAVAISARRVHNKTHTHSLLDTHACIHWQYHFITVLSSVITIQSAIFNYIRELLATKLYADSLQLIWMTSKWRPTAQVTCSVTHSGVKQPLLTDFYKKRSFLQKVTIFLNVTMNSCVAHIHTAAGAVLSFCHHQ